MDQSGLKWDAGFIRRFRFYPGIGQMFFGQFEHSIDEKGRITIPSQYRDLLDTLSRLIFANAAMLELDKAGRILIPQFLRNKAHLDGNIKLVGIGPYFEIWSPEIWEKNQVIFDDGEERARQFDSLNISF